MQGKEFIPLCWKSMSVFTNPATNARGRAWSHSSLLAPWGIAPKTLFNRFSFANMAADTPLWPSKIYKTKTHSQEQLKSYQMKQRRNLKFSNTAKAEKEVDGLPGTLWQSVLIKNKSSPFLARPAWPYFTVGFSTFSFLSSLPIKVPSGTRGGCFMLEISAWLILLSIATMPKPHLPEPTREKLKQNNKKKRIPQILSHLPSPSLQFNLWPPS